MPLAISTGDRLLEPLTEGDGAATLQQIANGIEEPHLSVADQIIARDGNCLIDSLGFGQTPFDVMKAVELAW